MDEVSSYWFLAGKDVSLNDRNLAFATDTGDLSQLSDGNYSPEEYEVFVDEQRFDPYRFWNHQHIFKETGRGIEMTDIVHYALPFSWLGRTAHKLNIEKKLQDIFSFRRNKLDELFGQLALNY